MLLLGLGVVLLLGNMASAMASQQQCESLQEQVSEKLARFEREDDSDDDTRKLTAQECRDFREAIKIYETYTGQADHLNCAFAYFQGQKIGGAPERAELLADLKKELKASCP
jgi:hypothetical protein